MAKEKKKVNISSDKSKTRKSPLVVENGVKLRIESLEVRHLLNAAGWDVALVDDALFESDSFIDISDADDIVRFNSETDSPVDVLDRVAALAEDIGKQIDSLSIISHGQEGALVLGDQLISANEVESLQDSLSSLNLLLSDNASIYIAGCNVGAGPEGQLLVDTLADITGASVFASDDITGIDGDWELEISSYNSIYNAITPFNMEAAASYQFSLGTNILTNGDFELPGTGIIGNNWGLIPGWSTDTNPGWSGVFTEFIGQGYSGFIRDIDPEVYQTTATTIQANKTYILTFLATDNGTDLDDDGNNDGGAELKASIYYDNAGSRVELESTTFTDLPYRKDYMDQTVYSVVFRADDNPAAIGQQIGVLFDNVSPVSVADNSFVHIDNVGLQVKDDTYVVSQATGSNLLTNADFELPGTGYINTGFGTVPGWNTDDPVSGSGVENMYDGNVGYTGFIMDGDPTLWQTSGTTVKADTTYTLSFWATDSFTDKNNNGGADGEAKIQASIYYMDGGVRVPVSTDVFDYLLFHRDEMDPTRYTVTFDSADVPAAVGNSIGVAFDNVTETTVAGRSWIHVDDVLLNESNGGTAVSDSFVVGTLDGVSDTTISDTVNGVDVTFDMASANGNFLDDSADITIQNTELKELLGFTADTAIDVFKFTNSADGDQQWMDISIGDTHQKVYLLAIDVDWEYDAVKFYDGEGNLLNRNRYIDSYEISNDNVITDQYILSNTGSFYHDGGVLTDNYTSVFDISGMNDVSLTWGDATVLGQAQSIQWTVVVVDQAPETVDDTASLNEDSGSVTVDIVANDIDRVKSGFYISNLADPTNGTAVNNGDGTITYTPDADYFGTETFNYTITNEYGSTSTGTISVTVNPIQDVPVGTDDSITVYKNIAHTSGNLLANDTDVDGDTLSISAVTNGTNGTVVNNGNGTVTYTPDNDYIGADSFTYTVNDGNGGTDIVTVSVTVNAPPSDYLNHWDLDETAGVTADDSAGTNDATLNGPTWTEQGKIDGALDFDGANDTVVMDREISDDFTISFWVRTTQVGGGSDGDSWFWGTGIIDAETNTESNDFGISLINDNIAFGASLTIQSTSDINDGQWQYCVATRDMASGVMKLYVNGVLEAQNTGSTVSLDAAATITFGKMQAGWAHFDGVLDDVAMFDRVLSADEVASIYHNTPNRDPFGGADSITVTEDTPLTTGNLLANDVDYDSDSISISAVTDGTHGSVVDNGDGTVTYTPDANYNGADSFTYTVSDGAGGTDVVTVSVTVNAVNDAPVGTDDSITVTEDIALTTGNLLANDSDVDGNPLSISAVTDGTHGSVVNNGDGTVTYTPDANYNGADSFTYTVSDGAGGTDVVTVSVTVNAVNDAPVGTDDSITVTEDVALTTGNLLANDSDTEGNALSISAVTDGTHGSVVNNGDGTVTYTPDANYNGADSFTYTVSDGAGGTDVVTVSVTVNAVNDAPVGTDDSITVTEDIALTTGNLLANDSDVDGNPLSISAVTDGTHGSVVNNGDGTVTYTPDANYNGADSFTYTVSDGAGGTDVVTVSVTVNAANDAPVGTNDSINVTEDTPLTTGNLLANDSDVDGDGLSISAVTNGTHGTVANNGDGTVTYTPDANYYGADSFTYTVSDGAGGTDVVTVTVAVNAVNDAPAGIDDSITVTEDVALTTGNLLANDSDVEGNALSISAVTDGTHGSVVNNGDGTVTYTPDANYNGADSFTYTVSDGVGGSDVVTVSVTVNAVNDAPVGTDDSITVTEDIALTTGNLLANDSDVDGNPLSISAVTDGTHGSVTNNGDGTVTYTPDANYNGADSFTYTVSDGAGGTDVVTVSVTVNAVNDAPVGTDDSITVTEDIALTTGNLLANDSDVEGNALSISAVTDGTHGTVVNNGDGTVTYTPDANYNGADSFTYTVSDGAGGTDVVTVSVTVNAVNDAPVGTDDSITVTEDIALTTGNLLANDSDVDGNPLSISAVTDGTHGSVVNNGDGTVTYTPDANYNGADSFTYTVSDGAGGTDVVTVSVTVNAVNDAPVGTDDSITVTEDIALTTGNLLANDSDVDGNPLSISAVTDGTHGSVTNNGDGTVTYTPDANYNGADSFTYTVSDGAGGTDVVTVSVTVNAVNDAPVGTDDSITVTEDIALTTGNLLANDSDVEGNALSISAVTDGTHGTVVNNGDGTVTYTPDANYNGADSFTYTVSDGAGGTDVVTVSVTVNAVNDAPVSADDSINVTEDVALTTGSILANDSDVDGDGLSISAVTDGTHGTVVNNGDGTITYTPDPGYNGADSFTYTISDGAGGTDVATVNVSVGGVNDAPVGTDDSITVTEDIALVTGNLLANDTDADGDTLSISAVTDGTHGTVVKNGDGTVTYTPDANYNGADSFTYTVVDASGGSDTVTVTVTVNAVNDAPVGTDDSITVTEDTPLTTGNLLVNDSDVEGDGLSISAVTDGTHGTVANNGDGTVTYTPDANYNGADSFTYTVSDGNGGTDVVTVSVTVNAVNDAPVGTDDSITVTEDIALTTGNLLANDSDVDGNPLSISAVTDGTHGTVANNGDGTVTYTPDANYNGADSFTYTVSDGAGGTDVVTVSVTVNAVNDAPVGTDDSITVTEDIALTTGNLLANDSDVEGDGLSISAVTDGTHGSVVNNGDGTVTYTPDANYNGADSFTYTVSDGAGGTDVVTVSVTVNSVNDVPVGTDDSITVTEDTPLTTGNLLANDSDVDGDGLSISAVTDGTHGTVVNNGDGTVTYTPDANYNGADSFTYMVNDGNGGTDVVTVSVSVNSVNDGPVGTDDSITVTEDTPLTTGNLLANDSDSDGDGLSISAVTDGTHGSVVNNGDGTVTYTPDANYNGADSFTYTVSDGNGGTDVVTVSVTVNAVNDAPVGTNDSINVTEDTPLTTGNLLANDSDVEGDGLSISAVTDGAHGTVVNNGDGTVTYTPDANYNGADSFTYTVSDGNGGTDVVTVTVGVNSVNDAPVGTDDSITVTEDTPLTTGNLLANDSDSDGDGLSISAVTDGAHGTVVNNGDGTVTYTPDANYNGADSFTYTVSDVNGGSDVVTVSVTVNSVNDAPVGTDDSITVTEDTPLTTGNLLANDSDVEGDGLSISAVTDGTHGTVVNNGDGTVTYTPDPGYDGADSFTYTLSDGNGGTDVVTVSVTVNNVNDAPVGTDDTITVTEDVALVTGNLLANDTDADGDPLSISAVIDGTHGTVVNNGDGTVTYTPDANYNGADSFTYTVSDGNGGTDVVTVSVTVNSVNDAPVGGVDSIAVTEDIAYTTGNLLVNDYDVEGDVLSISAVTNGAHGTVINNGNGTLTYIPEENYSGPDSFTYTISDGMAVDVVTVNVMVESVNDSPVPGDDEYSVHEDNMLVITDLLANDHDIDGSQLEIQSVTQPANGLVVLNQDGSVTYTPDENYNGPDSFTYTIVDSEGAINDALVSLTINSVEDSPLAVNDMYESSGQRVALDKILMNDYDPDGDDISLVNIERPENGYLSTDIMGRTVYVASTGFNGTETLEYNITDSNGNISSGTIVINVVNNERVSDDSSSDQIVTDSDIDNSENNQNDTIIDNSQENTPDVGSEDILVPEVPVGDNSETVENEQDADRPLEESTKPSIFDDSTNSGSNIIGDSTLTDSALPGTEVVENNPLVPAVDQDEDQDQEKQYQDEQTKDNYNSESTNNYYNNVNDNIVTEAIEDSKESDTDNSDDDKDGKEQQKQEKDKQKSSSDQERYGGDTAGDYSSNEHNTNYVPTTLKLVENDARAINLADIEMIEQAELEMMFTDSGMYIGLPDDVVISPQQDELTALILNKQSDNIDKKLNDKVEPEINLGDIDFTTVGGAVGSVVTGMAIAQGGISILGMSKSYAVISAIDPTPVIKTLVTSSKDALADNLVSGFGKESVEKILNLKK